MRKTKVKIKLITSTYSKNWEETLVLGLGSDNKIYQWRWVTGKWVLFKPE